MSHNSQGAIDDAIGHSDRVAVAAETPVVELRLLAQDSLSESIRGADGHAWLELEIARQGPDIWNRLLKSLPADQADALRQQIYAFVYELNLAGLDDDEATRRLRLYDGPPEPTDATPPEADAMPGAIEFHLRRGTERLQNGDYRQALVHFTNGLKVDPANAELYARRGDAYRLLGEARRALPDYDASLRLNPAALLPLLGRAAAYYETGAFENARGDANAALASGAHEPLAYRTRAAAAIELGDLESALGDLSAAIDLDPNDLAALQQRGQILVKLGDAEAAMRDLNRVLDVDPNRVAALLHRAHARRALGDHCRAIRDYSDVLRRHPGNALAFTARGLAHELNGDRDSALADHTEALRLEPENVQVYLNRAKLLRVKGDLVRARADLDEVLQRQPENVAALYHRGKIALAKAQWQQALDDLDAVVALNSRLGVAYASRAVIRDRLHQFPEALVDAGRAIELEPTSAAPYLVRGLIFAHTRETDAALADLTETLRLDDQIPLAYQERTIAWTLKGEYERALADVNRLLALEPGNAQAYAHRSMLLHLRGDVQPALVDYTRALQLDPRVLIAGWNQPLAEHMRNQTALLLADAIDGLRFRRNYPAAPAASEWNIVVEKPRPIAPAPRAEKRNDEPPISAPVMRVALAEPPVAASPPKPSAETRAQISAPAETATDSPLVPRKTANTEKKAPKPDPVTEVEEKIVQLEENNEFEEEVDHAIEALFADGPAPAEKPAPAIPAAASKSIEFAKPAAPSPAATSSAAGKPIDCPLCRHRLPPAETLSGGRFRCGNCNAIFFPGAAAPPAASFPASPVAHARPPKRAAQISRADDEEPTLLDKWKKPTPIAITSVAALVLLYFFFPTSLFGNSSHYSVHPAKGEATFEGKPIPNASIILYPINPKADNHPRPKAVVGAHGGFTLGTYGADDGAPEGEYKVSIVWNTQPTQKEIQEDRYKPRNQLPARYANPETSGLTARIEAGDNRLDAFVLKKK